MKLSLPVLLLFATGGIFVSASNKNTIINYDKVNGSQTQKGPDTKVNMKVGGIKRDLEALWKRDPDFEFAMSILTRNAEAAEKSVDQIIADIKHGTVDPQIVAAAEQRGLIKAAPGASRNGLGGKVKREARKITGPKGRAHSVSKIAQHIMSSGYIPPRIRDALIASKHYIIPGQHRSHPTKAPSLKGIHMAGTASTKHVGRDLDFEELYARAEAPVKLEDFVGLIDAMESSPEARKHVIGALNSDTKVQKMTEDLIRKYGSGKKDKRQDSSLSLFAREPQVTFDGMKTLVETMQDTPKVAKTVLTAFNNDENIASVTEELFKKYASTEELEKREAIDEEELWFGIRDAEAEAEAEAEADFGFDDEL